MEARVRLATTESSTEPQRRMEIYPRLPKVLWYHHILWYFPSLASPCGEVVDLWRWTFMQTANLPWEREVGPILSRMKLLY
jgi:hypothetical protein